MYFKVICQFILGVVRKRLLFAGLFILQVYSCQLREIYYFNLPLPCFPRKNGEFLRSLEIEHNTKEIGKRALECKCYLSNGKKHPQNFFISSRIMKPKLKTINFCNMTLRARQVNHLASMYFFALSRC